MNVTLNLRVECAVKIMGSNFTRRQRWRERHRLSTARICDGHGCKAYSWIALVFFHWTHFEQTLQKCPAAREPFYNKKKKNSETWRIAAHNGCDDGQWWIWRREGGVREQSKLKIENNFQFLSFTRTHSHALPPFPLNFHFLCEKWPFWIVVFRVIEPAEDTNWTNESDKSIAASLSAKYNAWKEMENFAVNIATPTIRLKSKEIWWKK